MYCDFLGSNGLQETHMDALKLFNFKYLTFSMRRGFFTKFAAVAVVLCEHFWEATISRVL